MPRHIDLTDDEYRELSNLLQLYCVLGVDLYIRGIAQPSRPVLGGVFGKLVRVVVPEPDPNDAPINGQPADTPEPPT
jgi:hypothetical protein